MVKLLDLPPAFGFHIVRTHTGTSDYFGSSYYTPARSNPTHWDAVATPCRSYVEAEKALARIPDRSRAPDAIVSDADGLAFYMKARSRFPGIRWIVTAARQPVAEPGNLLTGAVEVPMGSAKLELSPRLADRFLPGAGQPI